MFCKVVVQVPGSIRILGEDQAFASAQRILLQSTNQSLQLCILSRLKRLYQSQHSLQDGNVMLNMTAQRLEMEVRGIIAIRYLAQRVHQIAFFLEVGSVQESSCVFTRRN